MGNGMFNKRQISYLIKTFVLSLILFSLSGGFLTSFDKTIIYLLSLFISHLIVKQYDSLKD